MYINPFKKWIDVSEEFLILFAERPSWYFLRNELAPFSIFQIAKILFQITKSIEGNNAATMVGIPVMVGVLFLIIVSIINCFGFNESELQISKKEKYIFERKLEWFPELSSKMKSVKKRLFSFSKFHFQEPYLKNLHSKVHWQKFRLSELNGIEF